MSTPADGLCHLLANQFDQWLEGDVVGLRAHGDKIWHYGFRLPDGRVLDKRGAHDSEAAFVKAANEEWEPDFELVETEISEESVEIFSDDERGAVREFALKLIT